MFTDGSSKFMISWEEKQYEEFQQEKDINREIERFILDVLTRNENVLYCNMCSQFVNLRCGNRDRICCAQGIYQKSEILREKVPAWFSNIIQERAKKSVKQCNRQSATFLKEGL